jgi:hypothetical protein
MGIQLTCDKCGATRGTEKHFLQWGDDYAWVLDLCPKHAETAMDQIDRLFPDAATTTPRSARAMRRASTGQASYDAAEGVDLADVRAWALQKGIPVSGRGRIAGTVIEKYKKAHRIS